MKIMMISPVQPWPVRSGYHVVVHDDVRALAMQGHEVTLLAQFFVGECGEGDLAGQARIETFRHVRDSRPVELLRNVGSPWPVSVTRRFEPPLLARAAELMRTDPPDVVLLEDAVMGFYGPLLKRIRPVPVYLRSHNVFTVMFERNMREHRNPLVRAVVRRQMDKFSRFEPWALAAADGWSMITPSDMEWVQRLWPERSEDHRTVITAGVDLDYYTMPSQPRQENLLVHVGTLLPDTNYPGMVWFCRRVMPRVLADAPPVRLRLVGRVWGGDLRPERFGFLDLEGVVPDVRPHLHAGGVFVAPIFVGSGIKLKVLQAMATGNAVVTTSVGAEGIGAVSGEHLMVADDADSFADAVGTLLTQPGTRQRLGAAARTFIEENYSLQSVGARLSDCLKEISSVEPAPPAEFPQRLLKRWGLSGSSGDRPGEAATANRADVR